MAVPPDGTLRLDLARSGDPEGRRGRQRNGTNPEQLFAIVFSRLLPFRRCGSSVARKRPMSRFSLSGRAFRSARPTHGAFGPLRGTISLNNNNDFSFSRSVYSELRQDLPKERTQRRT